MRNPPADPGSVPLPIPASSLFFSTTRKRLQSGPTTSTRCRAVPSVTVAMSLIEEVRFASDSPLEGDGFELPVPRVLEPSQFIRLLDTAFAFCRRDRRRIGDRSHLPQASSGKNRVGSRSLSAAHDPNLVAFPVYTSVGPSKCEPDILLYRSPYKCFPLEKNRVQSIVGTWKLLHAT